jgi:drug/metabolite transporter (DMT)-like permease
MSKRAEAWFLLILLSVIWGSSFILIKKGLAGYNPFQVASLRICMAALSLLPVALYHIRKLPMAKMKYIFLFGLCNAGLPAFLFSTAQMHVNSSTAGILNSLTPIFTMIMGALLFGVQLTGKKFAGVMIGFCGACMLVFFKNGFSAPTPITDSNFFYTMLIVLATVLYGCSSNIMKNYLDDVSGQVISSFSYLIFAIPLSVYLFVFSDFTYTLTHSPNGLSSFGYISVLGIFGSAFAIVLFSRLLKISNALFGSFTTYLLPFVAILWGIAIDENIGIVPFISLGVILTGIFISNLSFKKTVKTV